MIVITETCCCGAKFSYTGGDIHGASRRREFAAEHQVCRERERPLVMWGGDQA